MFRRQNTFFFREFSQSIPTMWSSHPLIKTRPLWPWELPRGTSFTHLPPPIHWILSMKTVSLFQLLNIDVLHNTYTIHLYYILRILQAVKAESTLLRDCSLVVWWQLCQMIRQGSSNYVTLKKAPKSATTNTLAKFQPSSSTER